MKQKTPKAKCLDPAWRYVRAIDTDIGKRFDKIMREQRRQSRERPKVTQLRKLNK